MEWFGQVKRGGETENIRAVAEMKMEGKRPRGRPMLRWNDTVRRDLKARNIKEEWATDRQHGKVSARPATPNRETAAKCEKGEKVGGSMGNISLTKLLCSCYIRSMLLCYYVTAYFTFYTTMIVVQLPNNARGHHQITTPYNSTQLSLVFSWCCPWFSRLATYD